LLFGFAFGGGNNGEQAKVKVAIVDEDSTDGSRAYHHVARGVLRSHGDDSRRCRKRRAARRSDRLQRPDERLRRGVGTDVLWASPSRSSSASIPRRRAEAQMIEGMQMKHAAEDMQHLFNDPKASSKMVDKALGE
jgi:hypothetical protein